MLSRFVLSRVDGNKRACDIINKINIWKVIGWVKSVWRRVTSDTIKHCFEKCGLPTDDYVVTTQDSDQEFEILLSEIPKNCSIEECLEVDNNLATSEEVDVSKIEWREKLSNEYIEEVLKVETGNSDVEDED